MFHVILFQPEIPPNTGNIIRLCANAGAWLHLVRPLGFEVTERRLRRAGLDYHELTCIREHADLESCVASIGPRRLFAFSTRGGPLYTSPRYQPGDAMLFGPETRGLPATVLQTFSRNRVLRLPMVPGNRSLNLSNAVAVVVFEAWRQQGFQGAITPVPPSESES